MRITLATVLIVLQHPLGDALHLVEGRSEAARYLQLLLTRQLCRRGTLVKDLMQASQLRHEQV